MQSLVNWLQSNWLAVLGVLVIWLVYRLGSAAERGGVIRGVDAELEMHRPWVGGGYSNAAQIIDRSDLTKMVYKLSTVAIDNAVARGPSLFLNRNLINELVAYRQVVGHLNQHIDAAMAFQASPDLWLKGRWTSSRQKELAVQMVDLTDSIHLFAIGDQRMGQAHAHFHLLCTQLRMEKDSKVLPLLWLVTGINLFPLKPALLRYL